MKLTQGAWEVLENVGLFQGIDRDELRLLVPQLAVRRSHPERGEFLLTAGDCTRLFGLVLAGALHIVKEDFWGRRTILTEIGPGGVFAESYALMPEQPLEVSVLAAAPSDVLFLSMERFIPSPRDRNPVPDQAALVKNLLSTLAGKNLRLSRQVEHLSRRTVQERLLSYLTGLSLAQGTDRVEVPFNRQELADHLSVDRSTLSTAISKLRREGLIDCEGTSFTLRPGVPDKTPL